MMWVKAVTAASLLFATLAVVILTLSRRGPGTSASLSATRRGLRSLGTESESFSDLVSFHDKQTRDSECEDFPAWRGTMKRTCGDFAVNQWCTPDGKPGLGWKEEWGDIGRVGVKFSAVDACCACGGGSKVNDNAEYAVLCTKSGIVGTPQDFYYKVGDHVPSETKIGVVEVVNDLYRDSNRLFTKKAGVITKLAEKGVHPKDGVCAVIKPTYTGEITSFPEHSHGVGNSDDGGIPVKCPERFANLKFVVEDQDHVSRGDIVARAAHYVGQGLTERGEEVDCRAPADGYIWTKHFQLTHGASIEDYEPESTVAMIGPTIRLNAACPNYATDWERHHGWCHRQAGVTVGDRHARRGRVVRWGEMLQNGGMVSLKKGDPILVVQEESRDKQQTRATGAGPEMATIKAPYNCFVNQTLRLGAGELLQKYLMTSRTIAILRKFNDPLLVQAGQVAVEVPRELASSQKTVFWKHARQVGDKVKKGDVVATVKSEDEFVNLYAPTDGLVFAQQDLWPGVAIKHVMDVDYLGDTTLVVIGDLSRGGITWLPWIMGGVVCLAICLLFIFCRREKEERTYVALQPTPVIPEPEPAPPVEPAPPAVTIEFTEQSGNVYFDSNGFPAGGNRARHSQTARIFEKSFATQPVGIVFSTVPPVTVAHVKAGSPASIAGVKVGWLVTKIGDVKVAWADCQSVDNTLAESFAALPRV